MAPASAVLAVELFCLAALLLQAASVGLVIARLLRPGPAAPADLPSVTLLRPVCGLENNIEATLASSFTLDHPDYEVIFCVAAADDPVVPLVERLIAAHPAVVARLLVGDDVISGNPKLNNLVKGWAAARHDWIAMTDSNVALPPDYFSILLAHWTRGTGLVSSPAAGTAPSGFPAEIECAFLNTYQARWQLAADQVGLGFAQGKTLFWRRDVLDGAGGLARLGSEMAEDLAATKLVRAAGLRVRLVRRPFPQPLGARRLGEVWRRQLRWAQIRRMGFPAFFAAEILTGAFLPFLGGVWLAAMGVLPVAALVLLTLVWYLAELWLARLADWPASPRAILAWPVRDLMQPALWAVAWTGRGFEWRGNRMTAGAAPRRPGTD